MKKIHFKPEFQIIRQNEANAKFFVASGSEFLNDSQSTSTNPDVAASYDQGSDGSNDITM
ncbi:MAG: hypothetical protein MJ002_01790 [Paludibacteraceae bacterium]|nr:hypothetical protein [Paludibacteraceae bacterium]